jgi:hypothetical protein
MLYTNQYVAKINGKIFKLCRDKINMSIAQLYVNNELAGDVPYHFTIKRMLELGDKNFPVYKFKELISKAE